MTDITQLTKIKHLATNKEIHQAFLKAKHKANLQFVKWLKQTTRQTVDASSIFDCQIKRIHEYKRQLLNALRIVVLYNRFRKQPDIQQPPRTFFFAGKAAQIGRASCRERV